MQVSKRLKAVPLAFYQSIPGSLFSEKTDDFVGWRFNDSPEEELLSKSLPVGVDNTSGQVVVSKTSSDIDVVSKEDNVVPRPKKKRQSKGGSVIEVVSKVDKALPLPKKKKK